MERISIYALIPFLKDLFWAMAVGQGPKCISMTTDERLKAFQSSTLPCCVCLSTYSFTQLTMLSRQKQPQIKENKNENLKKIRISAWEIHTGALSQLSFPDRMTRWPFDAKPHLPMHHRIAPAKQLGHMIWTSNCRRGCTEATGASSAGKSKPADEVKGRRPERQRETDWASDN